MGTYPLHFPLGPGAGVAAGTLYTYVVPKLEMHTQLAIEIQGGLCPRVLPQKECTCHMPDVCTQKLAQTDH